jgi:hypothetical protein
MFILWRQQRPNGCHRTTTDHHRTTTVISPKTATGAISAVTAKCYPFPIRDALKAASR